MSNDIGEWKWGKGDEDKWKRLEDCVDKKEGLFLELSIIVGMVNNKNEMDACRKKIVNHTNASFKKHA